jgi:hypothetical protein
MGAKNSLTASDAQAVEEAFQARSAVFSAAEGTAAAGEPLATVHSSSLIAPGRRGRLQRRSKRVNKSFLSLPEPRRVRDRIHVKYVATQPCLVCGRRPADAHHIRFAQHSALGRRVSDEFTVPLCRGHHRSLHRTGDEARWWREAAIDPMTSARELWIQTLVARGQLPPDDSGPATSPRVHVENSALPASPLPAA